MESKQPVRTGRPEPGLISTARWLTASSTTGWPDAIDQLRGDVTPLSWTLVRTLLPASERRRPPSTSHSVPSLPMTGVPACPGKAMGAPRGKRDPGVDLLVRGCRYAPPPR